MHKRTDNTAFGSAKIMGNNKAKTKNAFAEGCEVISIFRHKKLGRVIYKHASEEKESKIQ